MWTQFWDMHSGGGSKEKWTKIYIEAPEDEARIIFYNRLGHSADRVTCTCCGEDYSVSEYESLIQATAYNRNCVYYSPPCDKDGKWTKHNKQGRYFEKGESVPDEWTCRNLRNYNDYLTLEEYCQLEYVLVIRTDEIKDHERKGKVPQQGFVWVD